MQIKKITSLVLAAALSISLAACGNSQTTAVTSGQDNQQAESTQTADSSEAKAVQKRKPRNLLRPKTKRRTNRQKQLRKTEVLRVITF